MNDLSATRKLNDVSKLQEVPQSRFQTISSIQIKYLLLIIKHSRAKIVVKTQFQISLFKSYSLIFPRSYFLRNNRVNLEPRDLQESRRCKYDYINIHKQIRTSGLCSSSKTNKKLSGSKKYIYMIDTGRLFEPVVLKLLRNYRAVSETKKIT